MKVYLDMLQKVLDDGFDHEDRTGTGRRSVYGLHSRFDLKKGFPLVTTKKINIDLVIKELLWFIKGSSNTKELTEQGVHIWDKWAFSEIDLNNSLEEKKTAIMSFCEKNNIDMPEYKLTEVLNINKTNMSGLIGDIGPIYGPAWRTTLSTKEYENLLQDYLLKKINLDKLCTPTKLAAYQMNWDNVLVPQLEENGHQFTENDKLRATFYNYLTNIDQFDRLMVSLKHNPYGSRHVVSAWIPENIPIEGLSISDNILLDHGALAPCHMMFQCFVRENKEDPTKPYLSLQMYQRSADLPVGVPFNIAQYALLTMMIANDLGYIADEFIYNIGDAHIYLDQIELVKEQLNRTPKELPIMVLTENKCIYDMTLEDFELQGYEYDPSIKYPVSK